MTYRLIHSILFAILTISNLTIQQSYGQSSSSYIPIVYRINQRQEECLYERFDKNDHVTFSVFVVGALQNGNPKAKVKFEGPVAGNNDVLKEVDFKLEEESITLGRELRITQAHWSKVKDLDQGVRYDKRLGIINRSIKVDWTHAGEHEDAISARERIEEDKRAAAKNYGRGAPKSDADAISEKFREIIQERIEPFEETNLIKASGWYRLCISAENHSLLVEMELRSAALLGGIDIDTKHAYTYDERAFLDEEKLLDEEIAAEEEARLNNIELHKEIVENQVKEQDLHASKAQIKHLNSMVTEMKKKHNEHHHRIKSHEAMARRNYEKMARSAKLETVLYVLITGFQVYTVHKWLLGGASLLGR